MPKTTLKCKEPNYVTWGQMMDDAAEKNFFSFRMLFTIFYWVVGTALMILSVYTNVSVIWGLAVVVAGTVLLVANFFKAKKEKNRFNL
jgi:hypothetical protein